MLQWTSKVLGICDCQLITLLSTLSLEGKSEWQALKAIRMPMPVFVLEYILMYEKRYVLLLSKYFVNGIICVYSSNRHRKFLSFM